MAHKLSKPEARAHARAMDLVHSDRTLTYEDKLFVLENFQESFGQMNGLVGAFFTPFGLARDLAIEVSGARIIDVCAGIGTLAFACTDDDTEVVCIERCAEYVTVGRRVVPHAQWIQADIFDVDAKSLGRFDCAIGNPPFGRLPASGCKGRYRGPEFEFRVIEWASRCAARGVFIVPQTSAPFRLSGQPCYSESANDKTRQFIVQTGIELGPNCGIDTAAYCHQWHGVAPLCEIVCYELDDPAQEGS